MDGSIPDALSGILSNPDALNKIMALMPAVAQMMNGSGSNNINQEKIIETKIADKSDLSNISNISAVSTENLMANTEVMAALKNLITAINSSAAVNNGGEIKSEAIPAISKVSPENDRRAKLLLALKPFLKEGRQTKIDTAIKYMNAAKIINMFGKNGFV